MKSAFFVTLLAALCYVVNLPAASIQKDDPLLEKSYLLSQKLRGPEQLYYLTELCDVSAHLHPATTKATEYSRALFDLASTEQSMRLHTAGQKNAVMCMSFVDPWAAMEYLLKIDFQPPRPGDWAYEDYRYNAAEKTFVNFLTALNGKITHEAISNIGEKARHLGQTGQYPYFGIAEVVKLLPSSLADDTNALVADALGFYAGETGFYNRDEEFLRLLKSLTSPPVTKDLAARIAATFVQRLKKDPIRFPGDYYAEIHIVANGKIFPFTDRNEAFLFQAFPQIRRFNPSLAAQLLQENPMLDQATDNMTYISGGFVQGDPTSEQAARQHLQWLQESLVDRIKQCQDSNPQMAASLAQRLTDLSSRIAGFSAAIPGIARTNPSRAKEIYQKQLSQLADLPDSTGRVRAIVALVSAAYHIGESREYQILAGEAFDGGARFLAAPADRMQNRNGFAELQDLVTFTASQATDILAAKVDHLPDDWLKAYLWLYEVKGHDQRSAPPEAGAKCE